MQQPHPLILCLCLPFQRNVSPSLALASHLLCIISAFGTSAVSYLHICHRFIDRKGKGKSNAYQVITLIRTYTTSKPVGHNQRFYASLAFSISVPAIISVVQTSHTYHTALSVYVYVRTRVPNLRLSTKQTSPSPQLSISSLISLGSFNDSL